MSNEKQIKNRLREICEQRGVSMYRLALDIGRKPNTITRIAKGERGLGNPDILSAICNRLNCDPGDILTRENNP